MYIDLYFIISMLFYVFGTAKRTSLFSFGYGKNNLMAAVK